MTDRHDELFISGEYVDSFRPDDDDNPFAKPYGRKRDAVIAAAGREPIRILDVGGGMGRMAVPLSARHHVTLCDLSSDMLRMARSRAAAGLDCVNANAQSLPFADSSFDCVIAIDLLPHVRRPEVALDEFRRVLATGGKLIIDSTSANPLWTLAYPRYVGRDVGRWWKTLTGAGVLPEWQGRVTHHRTGVFWRLIGSAGFRIVSKKTFGPRIVPKWHLVVAERC